MRNEAIIRTMTWEWDRERRLLWWRVQLTDGRKCAVGLPLAHVALTFREELNAPDVQQELRASAGTMGAIEIMGSPDIMYPESVDGWLSGIRKAFRKATRPIRKTIQRTTRKLAKTGLTALRYTRSAIRSPYMGYGLAALSLACPCVGGPALAAWAAAKQADNIARTAEKFAKQIGIGGRATPQQRNVISQAQQMSQRLRQLSGSNAPMARMLVAGFRSIG